MDNKEKIKLRIRALLAKTTDNGATESEMLEAMAKAAELMEKYFIDSNDLNDPFLGEKCVFGKTPIFKTKYTINYFYGYLARLFDCEYYYNQTEITFFGFENDVDLCLYFYKLIVKTCLSETEKYKASRDFRKHQLYTGSHTKTLINSFMKGFIIRVCKKLDDIYKSRQSERTTERGLILRTKDQKVKDAFEAENLKIRTVKSSKVSLSEAGFRAGEKAGDNFSITQGIKSGQSSTQKALEGAKNG